MIRDQVTAVAPGSVGNLGPGLDVLGLALDGPTDQVEARRATVSGLRIIDPGHPALPTDPTRHSAAIAANAVLRMAGADRGMGVELRIIKGLPLSGGQGGSAASAVAGAAAMNALLGEPLTREALVLAALEAEEVVAGRSADNVAASVLGGLVLIRSLDPVDLIRIPVPDRLRIVLANPEQELRTREGRAVLPATVPLGMAMQQAAQVAAIIAACLRDDLALLGRAIDDQIAEPARAPLLPGFRDAKEAALKAGAIGCSISGSGPTAFALTDGPDSGEAVARAMVAAYRHAGIAARARVARVDGHGVRVQ
jgi:homoserine kinase